MARDYTPPSVDARTAAFAKVGLDKFDPPPAGVVERDAPQTDSMGSLCERLRELLAKATPGPWSWDIFARGYCLVGPYPKGGSVRPAVKMSHAHIDGKLAVEVINALPILLAALEGGKGEAVPAGMRPWGGGDSAPDDWDWSKPVKLRDGETVTATTLEWRHYVGLGGQRDIIAYTPKASTLDADRERIARIIDPDAGWNPPLRPDGLAENYSKRQTAAFTKADAILASTNASRGGDALPPVRKGEKRSFLKCVTHGTPGWYDYVPYSMSTAVGVMPCGCDSKNQPRIDEAEYHRLAQPNASNGVSEGWRTIDSAPKDGSFIIAARFADDGESLKWVMHSRWITAQEAAEADEWDYPNDPDDYEAGWVKANEEDEQCCPTHWMPIPKPLTDQKAGS